MTPTTFRFRLEVLDVSVRRFAAMSGVSCETAQCWGCVGPDGVVPPFPSWVELVVRDWERKGVPKHAH
jgi:hypothetical protein